MGGGIKRSIVVEDYQIKVGIRGVDMEMPKKLKGESYCWLKKRGALPTKAGIEGLILQLNHDHRMIGNYLSATTGNQINSFLAARAYIMKIWMR